MHDGHNEQRGPCRPSLRACFAVSSHIGWAKLTSWLISAAKRERAKARNSDIGTRRHEGHEENKDGTADEHRWKPLIRPGSSASTCVHLRFHSSKFRAFALSR